MLSPSMAVAKRLGHFLSTGKPRAKLREPWRHYAIGLSGRAFRHSHYSPTLRSRPISLRRPPSRASQTSGATPLRHAVAPDGGLKAVGSFPKHGETPCGTPGAAAALRSRASGESHSALPLQPYATQPPHLPT